MKDLNSLQIISIYLHSSGFGYPNPLMASPQHMQLFRQMQQQQQQTASPFHGQFPHNGVPQKPANNNNNNSSTMEPGAAAAYQNSNQQPVVPPFPQASSHHDNLHQAGNNMVGHNMSNVDKNQAAFLVDSKPVNLLG